MDMGMDIDRELELEGQLFGTEHSDPSALQPPQEEEQPRKKQKLCTDEADPLEMNQEQQKCETDPIPFLSISQDYKLEFAKQKAEIDDQRKWENGQEIFSLARVNEMIAKQHPLVDKELHMVGVTNWDDHILALRSELERRFLPLKNAVLEGDLYRCYMPLSAHYQTPETQWIADLRKENPEVKITEAHIQRFIPQVPSLPPPSLPPLSLPLSAGISDEKEKKRQQEVKRKRIEAKELFEEKKKFSRLSEELFQEVAEGFHQKFQDHQLSFGKPIPQKYQKWVRRQENKWRESVNKIINRFVVRCTDTRHDAVLTEWKTSKYGFLEKEIKALTEGKARTLFADIKFLWPKLELKGGSKSKKLFWTETLISLSQYLFSGATYGMRRQDKVECSGLEFWPALGEDDDRRPEEKGDKFNTFTGLEIPPWYAVEWASSFSGEEKKRVLEKVEFLRGHFLNIICSASKEEADYLHKWYKIVYTKPWLKLDVHHLIRGDQGTGKTLFLAHFLVKLFGDQYCYTVRNAEELKKNFNSHLKTKLVIINEEITNPKSHGLASFLKAFMDSNSRHSFMEKYQNETIEAAFWKCVMITNEDWAYKTDLEERRIFATCARDNGYIQGVMEQKGWTRRQQYFDYLAGIDPRIFGYWLTLADTTNFDARRDAFVTQETGNQKQLSIGNLNPRVAFFNELLQNTLHDVLDAQRKSKGTDPLIASWIERKRAQHKFESSVVKLLDDLSQTLNQGKPKRFWRFQPKDADWAAILIFCDNLLQNKAAALDEDEKKTIAELKAILHPEQKKLGPVVMDKEVKKKSSQTSLPFMTDKEQKTKLEALRQRIRFLMRTHEPGELEKYTYCTWGRFSKRDVFRSYYVPYYELKKPLYDEGSKTNDAQFWKETHRIFPEKMFIPHKTKTKRLYEFPCLKEMKDAYAKNALKREDFFTNESKKRKRSE